MTRNPITTDEESAVYEALTVDGVLCGDVVQRTGYNQNRAIKIMDRLEKQGRARREKCRDYSTWHQIPGPSPEIEQDAAIRAYLAGIPNVATYSHARKSHRTRLNLERRLMKGGA